MVNKASTPKDQLQEALTERQPEINRETSLRRERIPVYAQNILTGLDLDPSYTYRWVNDLYGRINAFQTAGWEIVEGSTSATYSGKGREIEAQRGSQMWRTVNQRADAPCREAVLMRILTTLYNEDQLHKATQVDEDEKRIDPEGVIRKAQLMGPRANTNIRK